MAEKRCTKCNTVIYVPYVEHEGIIARMERIIKRQWIALILAISLLFCSFGLFVWYESQFETIVYEQDGDGVNNVNFGEQGDVNNEPESAIQKEEEKQQKSKEIKG